MKPLRLAIEGVKSFDNRVEIDFEALTRDGIFGVFGDTGSGKSTILDCIVLALYNRTQKSTDKAECVNFRCKKAKVEFTFEIDYQGKRQRIEVIREIPLKKDRTLGVVSAYLFVIDGNEKKAIADGTTNVNKAVEEIIGLTFEDFSKCIALPQGEFDKFTKAQRKERLDIIARLFNLEKYGLKMYNKATQNLVYHENLYSQKVGEISYFEDYNEELLSEKEREYFAKREDLKNKKQKAEKLKENLDKKEKEFLVKEEINKTEKELNLLKEKSELIEEKKKKLESFERVKDVYPIKDEIILLEKNREEERANLKKLETALKEKSALIKELEEKEIFKDYTILFNTHSIRHNELLNIKLSVNDNENKKQEQKRLRERYKEISSKISELETAKKIKQGDKETFQEILKSIKDEKELIEEYKNGGVQNYALNKAKKDLKYFEENRLNLNLFDDGKLKEKVGKELDFLIAENQKIIDEVTSKINLSSEEDLLLKLDRIDLIQLEKNKATENLNKTLLELEKLNGEISVNQEKLNSIIEQGKILSEDVKVFDERLNKITNGLPFEQVLNAEEKELKFLQENYKKISEQIAKLKEEVTDIDRKISASQQTIKNLDVNIQKSYLKRDEILLKCGIINVSQAEDFFLKEEESVNFQKEIELFDFNFKKYLERLKELKPLLNSSVLGLDSLNVLKEEYSAFVAETETLSNEVAVLEENLKTFRQNLDLKNKKLQEMKALQKNLDLAKTLKDMLYGRGFLEFVADEYLLDIAISASKTLLHLSQGRYSLTYDKEFFVKDNYNSGELRSVNTLSGGETFLVSLSLAFSLSVEIYTKSNKPIEFFFLDEGFGTLDDNLLETVMDSLEKLKSENFSIGLISHVKELKNRLTSKIILTGATEDEGSKIEMLV